MPLYKFQQSDIFHNRIEAHPQCNFFIYRGKTYYNNRPQLQGSFTSSVPCVPPGYVSLYEMNVDRVSQSAGLMEETSNVGMPDIIYPFIYKSPGPGAGSYMDFRGSRLVESDGIKMPLIETLDSSDIVSGSYPLSASIIKEYLAEGHENNASSSVTRAVDAGSPLAPLSDVLVDGEATIRPNNPGNLSTYGVSGKTSLGSKLSALKNTLNSYKHLSHHYIYSSSSLLFTGSQEGWERPASTLVNWDKGIQEMGILMIPSIFYGQRIEKGTISLKFYITGTLIGELRDEKENGELIQVGPSGSHYSGSTAGVALYNEGFMLLTGSWDLTSLPIDASALLTFDDVPANNDTVTVSDEAGNTVTFKFTTANDTVDGTLHSDEISVNVGISSTTTAAAAALRFRTAVNNADSLTNVAAAGSGTEATLAQDSFTGASGNTDLIISSSAISGPRPSKFSGGVDGAFSPGNNAGSRSHKEKYLGTVASAPRWIDFAQTIATGSVEMPSSSFVFDFKGTNYVPTMTMLAHARKGHLNFSNNPTYIKQGQTLDIITGSTKFREQPNLKIKNIVSSSYQDYTASYRRQTYISKVGIYDDHKNLIGIAKVATPVKKTEERDFTFKLKLDL